MKPWLKEYFIRQIVQAESSLLLYRFNRESIFSAIALEITSGTTEILNEHKIKINFKFHTSDTQNDEIKNHKVCLKRENLRITIH